MDSSRDFPFIRVISFVISLCLVLLIILDKRVQNFLPKFLANLIGS
jgi:hypothetical protein